ncbi:MULTISPECIES: BMC domain-containing protein [unclassified Halanaerobium]|uniref:BMC domain-containing protein n=1 Tax=unclassified Halanaerobium TaxID=2641197 RepID=UPI000DF46CEC|nr:MULTISPECIES: BMC domain-containing protein [unclassified Halanaerobium]RCW45656.1 microcompartment protein CcmL/EutN [Halanaerobium sp. MA284_MarDTE_T2]RCW88028.1 microcompartment protein CcmL/EutN [Halanaerobium sp. DL-01]
MITTIGLLEFNSISQGIKVADIMKKAADVDLILAQPTCPGKYTILISGDVSAVKSSVKSGIEKGDPFVVDHLVISRIHNQLLNAINATTEIEKVNAVGVLEYFSIASAIIGADAAAKAAQVDLIQVRLGTGLGGKAYVTFTGDVSAVKQALNAGAAAGKDNGMLYNKVFISSPDKDVFKTLL